MRLSTVFELLLIFLFLAFAASKTIYGKKGTKLTRKQAPVQNRYCQCTNLLCNCCRDFSLPVVSIKGPGCASVAYLNEDAMRLTMTFGDKVLRNITLAGKRPNPVCMALPGGVSKFCGRVYGITRDGDHFKACLALELRSLEDLEAALRVSCFRFGPEGVKLEPAKPVPVAPVDEDEDDDDEYGFDDDDEDDDDDDDFGLSDDDDDEDDDEDNDVDSGDADYTGFSALSDQFLEGFFGSSGENKKPVKQTTKAPQVIRTTRKPVEKLTTTTKRAVTTRSPQVTTTSDATWTTARVERSTTEKQVTVTDSGVTYTTDAKSEESDNNVPSSTVEDLIIESDNSSETENVKSSQSEEDETEEQTDADNNVDGIETDEEEEEEQSSDDNKESNKIESELVEKETEARRMERLHGAVGFMGRGENLTPEQTEQLFPGLTRLIRPPSYTSFDFPPVRSARTHRRMRLPPIVTAL